MLDIGIQELLVIMVLALLIFGPDKLPELGRRLGRAMREFRRASDEFRSTVEQNLQLNVDADISPATVDSAPSSPLESGAPQSDAAGTNGQGADSPVGQPVVAGTESGGEGPTAEELLEPYWTSRGGRLLHRRECAWRARVAPTELIPLKTAGEGWEQGLKPCPVCDPKEVEVAS
jgi:sec-independent protein translocase protein TatA